SGGSMAGRGGTRPTGGASSGGASTGGASTGGAGTGGTAAGGANLGGARGGGGWLEPRWLQCGWLPPDGWHERIGLRRRGHEVLQRALQRWRGRAAHAGVQWRARHGGQRHVHALRPDRLHSDPGRRGPDGGTSRRNDRASERVVPHVYRPRR